MKAGWYGKEPHRRQLWQCTPSNGDPVHRFAGLLPRQVAKAGSCTECEAVIESWEGPQTAKLYDFTTREVAQALAAAASGMSYRSTADKIRTRAHRRRPPNQRRNSEHPNRHGQLVANWVDVFAPVIWTHYSPTSWPDWLVIDAGEYRTTVVQPGGTRKGTAAFTVLAAVGYSAPRFLPRPWWVEICPVETGAAWQAMFSQLPGTPRLIVSDGTNKLPGAIRASFPRPGDPAPELRSCEWHLRRGISEKLPGYILPPKLPNFGRDAPSDAMTEPHHPIREAFHNAFRSVADFQNFEAMVRAEAQVTGGLIGPCRWLDLHASKIRSELQTRSPGGPKSVGSVENVLKELKNRIQWRASNFGNKTRTTSLLRLMLLEMRGQADEREWAEIIRTHLHSHRGRPADQRRWDDPAGVRSIRR